MADTSKPIWQSKTFWAAVLQIVAGVAAALSNEIVAGATITTFGVIQIVLRVLTSTPVRVSLE